MKIVLIEVTNYKRIKALRLVPNEKGLTTIGGKNGQGKSTVLDSITFGFGGKKYMPTNWKREGAVGDCALRIETDNGLIIERSGKNMDLKVTDKNGKRGTQALLDAFVSELSIDLPKFHNASSIEKAQMLLKALNIEEELEKIEREEKAAYDKRTTTGQLRDSKAKHAKEMPLYEDVLDQKEVSVADLIKQQQDILARNGIKEEHKRNLAALTRQLEDVRRQIKSYEESLESFRATEKKLAASVTDAQGEDFTIEPTDEIEKRIAEFDAINTKIRANAAREKAQGEADLLSDEYDALTVEIEKIRKRKLELLNGAKFPLPNLSVDHDKKGNPILVYNGKAWDCMSGSQQLIVDTAIASLMNPECKFVLLDKLEQLDLDTLHEFDEWLQERDLQCIATRVSTGGECSLVLEDGEGEYKPDTVVIPKPSNGLGDDDY